MIRSYLFTVCAILYRVLVDVLVQIPDQQDGEETTVLPPPRPDSPAQSTCCACMQKWLCPPSHAADLCHLRWLEKIQRESLHGVQGKHTLRQTKFSLSSMQSAFVHVAFACLLWLAAPTSSRFVAPSSGLQAMTEGIEVSLVSLHQLTLGTSSNKHKQWTTLYELLHSIYPLRSPLNSTGAALAKLKLKCPRRRSGSASTGLCTPP